MMYQWNDFMNRMTKQREARARSKSQKKANQPSFKRVLAEILFLKGHDAAILQALVVLHELTPSGVILFTSKPLPIESPVVVSIVGREILMARARVISCKPLEVCAGIVSNSEHIGRYRIQVEFSFASSDEAKTIRESCESIKAAPVRPVAA